MALLEALVNAVASETPRGSHPHTSDFRKKLRWLINNPPPELTKLMVITPEMAEVMMERNEDNEWRNRPQSERGRARYADIMRRGKWKLTTAGVGFTKSGRLSNGQHRLAACIQSGAAFPCFVHFGMDDESFKFEDIGISRTAGHIFSIENIPNANHIAAGARLLYGYLAKQAWDGRYADVENDVLLDFYYQHPRLQDAYALGRGLASECLMTSRWATFCAYICSAKSQSDAKDFFGKVESGIGLTSKTSPAFLIRKRLLENARSNNDKLSDQFVGAYFIQAWNAHRKGESRKIFRWRTEQSPNESFPRAE